MVMGRELEVEYNDNNNDNNDNNNEVRSITFLTDCLTSLPRLVHRPISTD